MADTKDSPSETRRSQTAVAVVGAGSWGRNLVRNFNRLGVLAGVCDSDPATLAWVREQYPAVVASHSFEELLHDPRIRGVVISTPAVYHANQARQALEAGKHVLVEKPLALDVGEGRSLVDLAKERNLVLMTGHILEYHPAVTALARLVREGALGRIHYIYSNRLNLGKVRHEENILWSFAPHDISVIIRLMGSLPTRVSSSGGSFINRGVADVSVTSMLFEGEARAHIFVSWLHPQKEQRLVVVGSKAMAVFNDSAPQEERLLLYRHDLDQIGPGCPSIPKDTRPWAMPVDRREPLLLECEDFISSITTGTEPLADGESALRVLTVLDAAQRSLDREGAPVELAAPIRSDLLPRSGDTPCAGSDDRPVLVHPTARVDEGSRVGTGTRIWHYTHVDPGAVIGEGCTLGQNVYVASRARIGDNVKVQNNVSVYNGVTLEDHVFCGPSAVFTNENTPRSHYPRRDQYQETTVRTGASIGANSTVVCGTVIGRHAFVAAGAVVTRDVPDHGLVQGNPARLAGWRCECGAALPFRRLEQGREDGVQCVACKLIYSRSGRVVCRYEGAEAVTGSSPQSCSPRPSSPPLDSPGCSSRPNRLTN